MRHSARVISGRGEGRKLGFPTLNLEVPPEFDARQGVHAGKVWIDGVPMAAAFHYGPAPTFGIDAVTLEAYVVDARLEQAPQELSFELVKWLRGIKDFGSPEALASQIAKDVEAVREVLKEL